MRSVFLMACLCLPLAGCMKAQQSTSKAMDGIEQETSSSWHKMRQALDLEKPKPVPSRKAQTRYCYRTYEDIVCYHKPVPGQEERLVAFQQGNSVGYTLEPAAEPTETRKHSAKSKPKPKPAEAAAPAKASADALPNAPMPNAPVPATKAADTKHLKEITFDPSELEPRKLVPDKVE